MAKVVQFLEIGNLPKSQLNPCRSRKVMIKNLIFFNFKERISAQFSHHFSIFFADIPLPRPPSLSAVPYGANNFNLKLESR